LRVKRKKERGKEAGTRRKREVESEGPKKKKFESSVRKRGKVAK
jgi:hypothetical protein